MYRFTQLVKTTPYQNQILANHLRLIQKQYFRCAKETNYFKHIKQDLDEYFFQFHRHHNRLNFGQKLEILETVVKMSPDRLFSDIMGIQNIIKSLSGELLNSNYQDDTELNISQYINILHSIGYYEKTIWFPAMDNYHKQGHLNWQQYKAFTDSIFKFQQMLFEDWQNNIVKDTCQEAWNDFIGFVEHSERLEIEPLDLLNTYQNIRKFKQYATQSNLTQIIKYYGKQIEAKQKDPQYKIPQAIYEFLLCFIFDHVKQKELSEGLEKLFTYLMVNIHDEYDNYRKLNILIKDSFSYTSMLRLCQEYYFHNLFNNQMAKTWSNEMYQMFMARELDTDLYAQMDNLIQLKLIVQQLKVNFFEEYQVDDMTRLIDSQALDNLKHLMDKPQNLYSLLNFYKTFEDEEEQQQYLNVLGKSHFTLQQVTYTDAELIACLEELDGQDIVYYLGDLLQSILKHVADNINKFSPEDYSITYYIVYKYLVKGSKEEDTISMKPDLDVLKQYIKLHFQTNHRRAIPLESNYFKILSVVELEEFYAEDIINYY